jgi:glycosyltransferase involved in cell wall biosynthesis
MRELIENVSPDVVHCHKLYPQLSVAPVVIASRARIPLVQTTHDYELISANALDETGAAFDRLEGSHRYRALNNATFPIRRVVYSPRVTRWVAVSRSVAGHLAAKGIKAEVIPNFVEPPYRPGRLGDARHGVAYVGRLSPEKGILDVLDVAAHLSSVTVKIAGEGPLVQLVERRAEQLPNLTYLGRLDHESVAKLISGCRAILVPSLWEEPGAIVVLEAMALGTPVIAYRSGGLAEYVEDAGAGVVINRSSKALADTVAELTKNKQQWEALSAAGFTAIEGRHAPERCVRMYEEVYMRAQFGHL